MTRLVLALALSAATVAVLPGCGGRAASPRGAASGAPSMAAPPATGSPRDQIIALSNHIDGLRSRAGMPSVEAVGGAADASPDGGADAPSAPTTAGTAPRPANKSGHTPVCRDVCDIASAICRDAGRICGIANGDLAGDPWAADMCKRAENSCTDAKQRCTRCKDS